MSSAQSYLALVRVAPARRLIYALFAACISYGMLPLAILLSVQEATGSYPNGGFAVACFGVTAGVSAPFRGRLVDRRGARRWLPGLACASAACLVALDLLGELSAPTWVLIGLAGFYFMHLHDLAHDPAQVLEELARGLEPRTWAVLALTAMLALLGSFLVSYTRARAEGLGIECKVGWFERPERLVLFVDEIDTTLRLDFTDDFFAAIRFLYQNRAAEPDLQRLGYETLRETDTSAFGGGQAILVVGEALVGGSDPRKDGYAGGI